jgi:hypothetical protein
LGAVKRDFLHAALPALSCVVAIVLALIVRMQSPG